MQKDPLTHLLTSHFQMHPSRLETAEALILGFLKVRHIHQHRLAASLPGDFPLSAKIKKVSRFFAQQEIDETAVALIISEFLPKEPWILSLDRTNWQFGDQNINILTLAVVMGGIAIPVGVEFLDKKGNSNTAERCDLLRRFVETFGAGKIDVLLADREFIGDTWVQWLEEQGIRFVIRVKKDQTVLHPTGQKTTVQKWMTSKKTLAQKTQVAGVACQLAVKTLPSKELLAVIASPDLENPLTLYRLRWDIETLFKSLKSNGFQLEETHVKDLGRLKKLVLLLAIAFAIAVKAGQVQHQIRPIPFRKTVQTKLYSWFRWGLDFLTNLLFKPPKNITSILKNIFQIQSVISKKTQK